MLYFLHGGYSMSCCLLLATCHLQPATCWPMREPLRSTLWSLWFGKPPCQSRRLRLSLPPPRNTLAKNQTTVKHYFQQNQKLPRFQQLDAPSIMHFLLDTVLLVLTAIKHLAVLPLGICRWILRWLWEKFSNHNCGIVWLGGNNCYHHQLR